jgi:hypothetical protein
LPDLDRFALIDQHAGYATGDCRTDGMTAACLDRGDPE